VHKVAFLTSDFKRIFSDFFYFSKIVVFSLTLSPILWLYLAHSPGD